MSDDRERYVAQLAATEIVETAGLTPPWPQRIAAGIAEQPPKVH